MIGIILVVILVCIDVAGALLTLLRVGAAPFPRIRGVRLNAITSTNKFGRNVGKPTFCRTAKLTRNVIVTRCEASVSARCHTTVATALDPSHIPAASPLMHRGTRVHL
jgi:hypothetical protein